MDFMACETAKKLSTMKTTVIMLGISLLNPWLYFREMVKQISKNPAKSRKIHAIDMLSTYT